MLVVFMCISIYMGNYYYNELKIKITDESINRLDRIRAAHEANLTQLQSITDQVTFSTDIYPFKLLEEGERTYQLKNRLAAFNVNDEFFNYIYNDIINMLLKISFNRENTVSVLNKYDVFTLSNCLSLNDLDDMLRKICNDLLKTCSSPPTEDSKESKYSASSTNSKDTKDKMQAIILRRMGNDGASIFSLGEWAWKWDERIHSEELIKKAADVGVNTIYTHFFKGFGLVHEHEEMDKTKALTELAHKYKIDVIGYCQFGSLYYETMLDEFPGLDNITIKDENGKIISWFGQYYRWRPCFNSIDFKDYLRKVIDYGIKHVNLDGFHFDNSGTHPCYCENCQKNFRAFLESNIDQPRQVLGIKHFRHVRIPTYNRDVETHDPLYIWWLKYLRELTSNTYEDIFAHVKLVSNGRAAVLHNPGFPKDGYNYCVRGFEPMRNSKHCDYIFSENEAFIRKTENGIVSQVEAFKFGQRFGYKVFDICWLYDAENRRRLPQTYEEIIRFLAQSMIFGGITGSPWLVRSLKHADSTNLDIPIQYKSISKAFRYFTNNSNLYGGKALNYVKLLYYPINLMGAPGKGKKVFSDTLNELVDNGIAFSIVSEDDLVYLNEKQILIIPELHYTEDNLYYKLLDVAKRGCHVLILGEYGIYNENGKERDRNDKVYNLIKQQNICHSNTSDWIGTFRKLNSMHNIILDSDGIMVETALDTQGRIVLHLLRPENDDTLPFLKVTIYGHNNISDYQYAELYSIEDTQLLNFKIAGDTAKLVISNFKTMATVVFR